MHAIKLVMALTAVFVISGTSPAFAATTGNAYVLSDGLRTSATKDEPAPTAVNHAVTTPQPVCTYSTIPDSPDAEVSTQDGSTPLYDSTHSSTVGTWEFKQCIDATGNGTLVTVWFPKADPAAIAQQAIATQSLPLPGIATSPPLPAGAVVNFPTWLWVDPAGWHAVTATAAVDGFSVTATAAPTAVTWNMGDGKTVTCIGPGTAYDTTKPDATQHSDCTYSYAASSANQPNHAYSVTATVQWRTTWQASDGTNGQLATINRTSTTSVPVREIQSINVAPAGGW